MTKQQKIKAIIASVVMLIISCYMYVPHTKILPSILFINTTASVPRGIYIKIPGEVYKQGDIVVYEPPEAVKTIAVANKWCRSDELFLKKIGAMPHDIYKIDEITSQFTINGKYIGNAFEKDSKGYVLPKLRGEFMVPDDEFLPITYRTQSFDGRYTGTVPLKDIKAKVVPMLIEFTAN